MTENSFLPSKNREIPRIILVLTLMTLSLRQNQGKIW